MAVLITGPPGAGKSTAANAVHDRLGEAGVANALVEVDELERCYPPRDPRRVLADLAGICASYRADEYELLFVTATVEDDVQRVRLQRAVGVESFLLVRLHAEPAVLRDRIRAREPADWFGLGELLDAATRLAAQLPGLTGVDLVLDSAVSGPIELAERIEDAIARAGTHERGRE
nr:AAA family ATPase [Saccharopolyspora sp. HNM0983]